MKVPSRDHYKSQYFGDTRVFSYAHQIRAVTSFQPESILEVGVGAGVVAAALRAMGYSVTTLDLQPELEPDIVGSVVSTGCKDKVFDVAICCQVLEHLPFIQFEQALYELRRITRHGLVLSLPDVTPYGFIAAKLPKLPEFKFEWSLPNLRPTVVSEEQFMRDGHYWEIGRKDVPRSLVLESIDKVKWSIHSTWSVPEMRYHRFFKLTQSGSI